MAGCGGGGEDGSTGGGEQGEAIKAMLPANGNALATIEPGSAESADLEAFGKAVGDARIVFVTEPAHGEASTLTLATRLIKYLHQHKNFDVLLLESGMFDIARMKEMYEQRGMSYTQSSAGRIFYMDSRTPEGRQITTYVDQTQATARPLRFAGLEMMMGGLASTSEGVARLEAYLTGKKSPTLQSVDWPQFKVLAQRVAELPERTPAPKDLGPFNRVSAVLDQELCTGADNVRYAIDSDGFWCRTVRNWVAASGYLWNKPGDVDYVPRDVAAAANIAWFLEGPFKDKKAVIFTAAFHGVDATPALVARNTASELKQRYPGQIHTAYITVGGLNNDTSDKNTGALEYYLRAVGNQPRYLAYPSDSAARALLSGLSVREWGFTVTKPSNFGNGYQSLFYVPSGRMLLPDWAAYPPVY
ncbi:hypothetical protein BJP62_12485 [Jeongeupia sp. USM3]|nr:hypothetical protein BJP62_12485 [Jeongeupia sp. USM3]